LRRRLGLGCRRGRRSWRQERERIDVALVLGGQTYAEVHERLAQIDDAAGSDRAHDGALGD
jgi:hypothetical protein